MHKTSEPYGKERIVIDSATMRRTTMQKRSGLLLVVAVLVIGILASIGIVFMINNPDSQASRLMTSYRRSEYRDDIWNARRLGTMRKEASEGNNPGIALSAPYLIVMPDRRHRNNSYLLERHGYGYFASTKGTTDMSQVNTVVVATEKLTDSRKYRLSGYADEKTIRRYAAELHYYDVITRSFVDYIYIDTAEILPSTTRSSKDRVVPNNDIINAVNNRLGLSEHQHHITSE